LRKEGASVGLYDSVECDYPLPDPEYQELEFQTRDFEWVMQRYAITRDGRLLKRAPRPEPGRELIALERDAELPVHGDLLIYAADPATDQGLIEYRVRFLHGRVERVQRWEGFGAERRRRLPRREPAALEPKPPRLQPGAMGRPITAEELVAHAPSRLELLGGRIPGEKGLLLLILTSLGVRRAAALVGYEVWKKGLE
jgi:hypothetical protein